MSLRVARGRGAAASRRLDDAHGIACGAAPNIAPSSCNADPFHFPDRLLAKPMMPDTTRPIPIAADRAGPAAVELALFMPLFATLSFGTYDAPDLLPADRGLTA